MEEIWKEHRQQHNAYMADNSDDNNETTSDT